MGLQWSEEKKRFWDRGILMKRELNAAISAAYKSGTKIDEIFLFKEMARQFNTSVTKCSYVEEIHGKIYVDYISKYALYNQKSVELGDLWIFTYDKAKKKLRMCIMQIKYKKRRYYRFLDIPINVYQWELLKERPAVMSNNTRVPSNILNFRDDYDSITTYGIFYHDNISKNRDVDFLYTLPKFLIPKTSLPVPLTRKEWTFGFTCPQEMGSPNFLCQRGFFPKETVSACSIDIFEQQVLAWRVGVPIDGKDDLAWALALLERMKEGVDNTIDDASAINTILDQYGDIADSNLDNRYFENGIPRALIIVTDSEKYNRLKEDEITYFDT